MGVDLYAEVLRHLATGIVIFNFEDKDLGREKLIVLWGLWRNSEVYD